MQALNMPSSNGFDALRKWDGYFNFPLMYALNSLNKAVIVSQFSYWLSRKNSGRFVPMCIDTNGVLVKNCKWAKDSIKDLRCKFKIWTPSKIYRIIQQLLKDKILLQADLHKTENVCHIKLNSHGFDVTKWYTVNNHKIQQLFEASKFVQNIQLSSKNPSQMSHDYRTYKIFHQRKASATNRPAAFFTSEKSIFHQRKKHFSSVKTLYTKKSSLRSHAKKSIVSPSVSSETANAGNLQAPTSTYNAQSSFQDSARPSQSSWPKHPDRAPIPSGLSSEKEKIAAEKKDAKAFNQPKIAKNATNYAQSKAIASYMAKCLGVEASHWMPIIGHLLLRVQPNDIYGAISSALKTPKQITHPVGYIDMTSVRIAKKREVKAKHVQLRKHKEYVLRRLVNMFFNTASVKKMSQQGNIDIEHTLSALKSRLLSPHARLANYTKAIKSLEQNPQVIDPLSFVDAKVAQSR